MEQRALEKKKKNFWGKKILQADTWAHIFELSSESSSAAEGAKRQQQCFDVS